MAVQFNADEIFEIAEQVERNGARFYRAAAEQADDEKSRTMLRGLADWEKEHERTFASMRKELSSAEGHWTAYDPGREAVLYLQAFADGYIFDVREDPSERIGGEDSAGDILRVGLELEKDSIVFYVGIRDLVPENQGRDKVETIIREEMKHVRTLTDALAEA